jgi:hypothetical protein
MNIMTTGIKKYQKRAFSLPSAMFGINKMLMYHDKATPS